MFILLHNRGHAVTDLVEALSYKSEGRGRWVGLTTLPLSSVDFLEIWEPQPLGTLRAYPGSALQHNQTKRSAL